MYEEAFCRTYEGLRAETQRILPIGGISETWIVDPDLAWVKVGTWLPTQEQTCVRQPVNYSRGFPRSCLTNFNCFGSNPRAIRFLNSVLQ